jgi:hypothetical protein
MGLSVVHKAFDDTVGAANGVHNTTTIASSRVVEM